MSELQTFAIGLVGAEKGTYPTMQSHRVEIGETAPFVLDEGSSTPAKSE